MRPTVALLVFLTACAGFGDVLAQDTPPAPTSRPFRLGFTTEPGGPTGGDKLPPKPTIRFVRSNADFLVVHRDGPRVPWLELSQGRTRRFARRLAKQRARLGTGYPLFLVITPLNIFRNGIGGEWPDELGQPCVSNPQLQAAFKTYARVAVESMQPDYLALGAEVNIYALTPPDECPDDFEAYVALYKETYNLVEAIRPDLPVFVTFQLDFMHIARQQMFPLRFLPELDRLALSFYPGGDLTQMTPDQIPPDYISWARVSTDLPLVISETGYGTVSAGGAVGSIDLQIDYVAWLLDQAERQDAEFVTWFFSTDPRYVEVPPGLDFINSFRSMGLASPSFRPKPAMEVWRGWLGLPLVPPMPSDGT